MSKLALAFLSALFSRVVVLSPPRNGHVADLNARIAVATERLLGIDERVPTRIFDS